MIVKVVIESKKKELFTLDVQKCVRTNGRAGSVRSESGREFSKE